MAVVIAFFVCYAPLYLQRLLLAIVQINNQLAIDSPIFAKILAHLYVISGATFYFGSVINPILYNVVSNKYRRAFRDLFCCRLTCKTKNQRKFYPNNRAANQPPVHYIVRKSPTRPGSPRVNSPLEIDSTPTGRLNGYEHEIHPISSNSHSSRSNPSSLSSRHRDDYSIRSLNSHGSLDKECQVIKARRFSLRRTLLGQKQAKETVPWLIGKTRV